MHTVKIEWIYECLGAYIRPALPGVITLCVAMAIGREGGRFFSSDLGAYETGRRGMLGTGPSCLANYYLKESRALGPCQGLGYQQDRHCHPIVKPPACPEWNRWYHSMGQRRQKPRKHIDEITARSLGMMAVCDSSL